MTAEEIHKKLKEGYDDIQAGRVQDAVSAFAKFSESHRREQYTVQITDKALADMEEIYNYIAIQLQAPENAIGQYNRIAKAIEKLNMFLENVRLMESEQERTMGLRQLVVDDGSVFY